jgi:saccharopepsin
MARWGENATWGSSVLKNIFSQEGRNESNFIALDLSRTDDLEDVGGGSFSIGEYAEPWKAVAQAPKLYQYPQGGDRWTTLLEGISVGGSPLNISSLVRGAPEDRLVALLDTGVPYTDIPSSVRNDLYSRIPGAVTFIWPQGPPGRVWMLPCNTTTIVEFTFG